MSLAMVVRPVYAITCDADGCTAEVRETSEWYVRVVAEVAGWQLRPRSGRGSRTAPDFCPEHREPAGGGDRP